MGLRFGLSLRSLEKSSSNASEGNCKLLTLHSDEYFRAGGLGGELNWYGIESDDALLDGVRAVREFSAIV
jgi:hypothetical protein